MRKMKDFALSVLALTCALGAVAMPRLALAQAASDQTASPETPAPLADEAELDAATKSEAIAKAAKLLTDVYIFPDVGAKAAAMLTQNLAAGKYDAATTKIAFADMVTKDLQDLTHDRHIRVLTTGYRPSDRPATPPPQGLTGFVQADRLKGNIGYIVLNGFPAKGQFKWGAGKAMAAIASTDALIIDLRNNGGGDPLAVAYLVSFFFDSKTPVHIIDVVWRKPGTQDFGRQVDSTEPTPLSYLGKPVYLITSHTTFSGGEEFAYDMQTLKRATLIGEATGGGAHPGGVGPIGPDLGLFVPRGRSESPITHGDWEGKGVQPDVAVPADQGFAVAYAAALQALKRQAPTATTVDAVTEAHLLTLPHTTFDDFKAEVARQGFDKTASLFHDLQAKDANFMLFDVDVNMWGYDLMQKGDLASAIAVFTLNTQLYPDDWNTFDSLGEAYANHGDKDLAIAAYRHSLALNPQSDSGKEHLKALGG